jgi:hypothetical protein
LSIPVGVTGLAYSAGAGCSAVEQATTGCTNNGSEIIVDGTQTNPGTSPIGTTNPGPRTGGPWYPPPEFDFGDCLASWDQYIGCFRSIEDDEEADAPEDPGMPAVTIADLAQFAPDGSVLAAEPGNVGVAGLPANFVATASEQTVAGSLFGYPISVRFTPSGFDFDYGDGDTLTTSDGGTTWEALGQAQFTPTSTSHTYAERGTYYASVDVRYTAEIDLGVGWFPIAGEVTSAGPDQEIRIFEAHTALVAHTCAQAPDSPGC